MKRLFTIFFVIVLMICASLPTFAYGENFYGSLWNMQPNNFYTAPTPTDATNYSSTGDSNDTVNSNSNYNSWVSPYQPYNDVQPKKSGASVTVLMYHKLSENENEWSDFCISPSMFEEDIKKLKELGFTFLKPEQLKEELSPDKKYVLLTFDDGYESDYLLTLPILEKQQVPATFFIIGGYVDSPEYMTKEQVKKLSESEYAVIGSHSMHLHRLPQSVISRNLTYPDFKDYMVEDFVSSIKFLSELTGKPVACISYPNGLFSEAIDAGIKAKFDNVVSFSSEINKVKTPLGDKELAGRYNRHLTLDVAEFRY